MKEVDQEAAFGRETGKAREGKRINRSKRREKPGGKGWQCLKLQRSQGDEGESD